MTKEFGEESDEDDYEDDIPVDDDESYSQDNEFNKAGPEQTS